MSLILKLPLYLVAYVYFFYLGFLIYSAVMNHGWGKLPLFLKVILTPPGLIFLVADVAFNCTVAIPLFAWQLPTWKTLTLSKRMAANIATGAGDWRGRLSHAIVDHMLLPFTPYY